MSYYPPLYIQPMEKAAEIPGAKSKHKLEGKPEMWPQQILQALYTDHPFLGDRDISTNIKRLDPEEGYAIGYLSVGDVGDRIQIPFVVRDRVILPFAVFMRGEDVYPLTEDRAMSTTVQEAAIEGISPRDRDISTMLREQEWEPPNHESYTGNRGIVSKLGSVPNSVLARFKVAMENPDYACVMDRVKDLDWMTEEKTAADPNDLRYWALGRTVMAKEAGAHRYELSRTEPLSGSVETRGVSRPQLESLFGKGASARIATYGSVVKNFFQPEKTASVEGGVIQGMEMIDRPGVWSCMKTTGSSVTGVAITKVVDFSGLQLPLKLFYNGTEAAVQDQIVGVHLSDVSLPPTEAEPEGECIFAFRNPNGLICSTIPFVVQGRMPSPAGEGWVVETYLGDKAVLIRTDVHRLAQIEPGTYAVPAMYSLVNIGDPSNRMELVSNPAQYDALQKMSSAVIKVQPINGGFRLKGACNVSWADADTAALHLAAAGATHPRRELQKAAEWNSTIVCARKPRLAPDNTESDRLSKQAEAALDRVRPKIETLVKMAAHSLKHSALPPRTADDVLALGFVGPTNTRTFLSYYDDLEDSNKKLASLVLASQLGYSEIPEDEVTSAMFSMEEVLSGLRRMKTLA